MVVAVGLLALGGAYATEELPFVEGFESGSWPAADWTQSGSGTAVVNTASAKAGTYGLQVTNTTVNVAVDDGGSSYTNVWIQILAKPGAWYNTPAVPTDVSAAFYVTTGGVVRVYTNDAWGDLAGTVPTDAWLGFAAHLDYDAKTWDLYVDTAPDGDNDTFQRIGQGLAMDSSPSGELHQVSIETEALAYVDAVAGSPAYVTVAAAGSDYNNLMTVATRKGLEEDVIPNAGTHDSSDDLLTVRLGDDLLSGVQVGDSLTFTDTNLQDHTYNVIAGPDWAGAGGGEDPIGSFNWTVNKGGTLDRSGTSTDAYAFLGYNTLQDEPAGTYYLAGTDAAAKGWNQLANAMQNGARATHAAIAAMFPSPNHGDEIWIWNGRYYIMMKYLGSTWSVAQGSLPARTPFWYWRKTTGAVAWTPTP